MIYLPRISSLVHIRSKTTFRPNTQEIDFTPLLISWLATLIGWIPGLFTFFGLGISVQAGPMFDRSGPKGNLIAGTACYVTVQDHS